MPRDEALNVSTINLRVLAAAEAFASKDETRYYLNGVCIEIDARSVTYVATDGHRLIAFREDVPPDGADNLLVGTFIIPTVRCKPFKLSKDDAAIGKIFGNGRLSIAHNLVDVTFMPIEGIYPDWRRALPQGAASGALAQFNLKLLADFKKFAEAMGLTQPFIAPNGDGPAYVWFSGRNDVLGMIMPMRATDELGRVPQQWGRIGPARDQTDLEEVAEGSSAVAA